MFLVSCTPNYYVSSENASEIEHSEEDFAFYMGEVAEAPYYVVDHMYETSGFLGMSSQQEEATYTISNFLVAEDEQLVFNFIEPRTMVELQEVLDQYDFFNADKVVLSPGVECFLHQESGVSAAIACFDASQLMVAHLLTTEGNKKTTKELWKLHDFEYPKHSDTCEGENFFCDVLTTAKQYDENACLNLGITKEYCQQIIV